MTGQFSIASLYLWIVTRQQWLEFVGNFSAGTTGLSNSATGEVTRKTGNAECFLSILNPSLEGNFLYCALIRLLNVLRHEVKRHVTGVVEIGGFLVEGSEGYGGSWNAGSL